MEACDTGMIIPKESICFIALTVKCCQIVSGAIRTGQAGLFVSAIKVILLALVACIIILERFIGRAWAISCNFVYNFTILADNSSAIFSGGVVGSSVGTSYALIASWIEVVWVGTGDAKLLGEIGGFWGANAESLVLVDYCSTNAIARTRGGIVLTMRWADGGDISLLSWCLYGLVLRLQM